MTSMEQDSTWLGCGRDDCEELSDEEPWDPIIRLADINKEFQEDEAIFEGKELPVYDDIKAGPRNLGPDRKRLSPIELFSKLWPVILMQAVVIQTNVYYLRTEQAIVDHQVLLTVRELYVWLGLHIKMMLCWSGNQDDYFYSTRPQWL